MLKLDTRRKKKGVSPVIAVMVLTRALRLGMALTLRSSMDRQCSSSSFWTQGRSRETFMCGHTM